MIRWRVLFIALAFLEWGSPLFAESNQVVIGGREWMLKVRSNDEVLRVDIKRISVISWCFEGYQGRGLLKDVTLHLSWMKGVPQLSLGREEITVKPEDRSLLSCLDATFKEYPPKHTFDTDEVNFQYTVKRRR